MVVQKNPANPRPTRKKKPIGPLGWCVRGLLLICALGIFILVVIRWKITSPPKFYVERLANSELLAADPNDDLEAKMLDFRNQTRKVGTWQGTFTEDSVNRWFAIDLPKKFSSSLPPNVTNPRIALSDGRCQFGITASTFFATGVVWVDARIERAQEPNSFAVHVDELRYGTLPIPLAYVEKPLVNALSQQKISGSWVDGPKGRVLILNFPPVLSSSAKTFAAVENMEFNAAQFRIVVTTRLRDQ